MTYEKGDIVTLEIIEALPEGRFIASLDGNLIRTKPILTQIPKVNDKIKAKIVSVNPLEFQAIGR